MTNQRESLLKKLRALLAKTEDAGCTEAEAMAALSLASQLMQDHEVSPRELQETVNESAIIDSDPQTNEIRGWLSGAVGAFTSTQIWTQGKKLCYCGMREDVEFAKWLLKSLTGFVYRGLLEHLKTVNHLKAEAQKENVYAWKLGCCNRISKRLNELTAQRESHIKTSNGRALMTVKSNQITAKMASVGISLVMRKSRAPVDYRAYKDGQQVGDRAQFSRPLDHQGGPKLISGG